jgi:hypothetical protein
MKDYHFYLFTKLYDVIIGEESEYDLMFDHLVDLHEEYEMSHFNNGKLPEYECIVNFLNHKKQTI